MISVVKSASVTETTVPETTISSGSIVIAATATAVHEVPTSTIEVGRMMHAKNAFSHATHFHGRTPAALVKTGAVKA